MSERGALVYVVDDEASVREGVASLIRSAGLEVRTFASGQQFLAARPPEVPSCLVLDLNLPGLSGLDLQQELARSGVQIPIIFLTGHGELSVFAQCRAHSGMAAGRRTHRYEHRKRTL